MSGRTSALAPPVPAAFLTELRRRACRSPPGGASPMPMPGTRCLLEVVHALELPRVLLFNRGLVKTTSQGVSKATGLRVALETLRLSVRNTVAIGDAENDHELLRLAEVGVAVAWGSQALQKVADIVLDGHGPEAVGAYIQTLAASAHLPVPPRGRRLLLGHLDDGREFSLAVRGRNVLVTGDANSGKS